eukprot:382280-Prorocentrum_lima.AAC.1
MHPHLRAPGATAGSGMVDEVGGNRSAPRAAPSTLLDARKRKTFGSKGRRKQKHARRVEGVGAAKR